MSKSKKSLGLGKGLEALIPTTVEITDKGLKFKSTEENKNQIDLIDLDKIEHNPYQPRVDFDESSLEELKNSIIEHGVIQPITVRRSVYGFEIISGERRVRAAKLAGLEKIPAYILQDITDVQMLQLALIENLQRDNLNPIEVANGYSRLIEECKLTQEEVAQKVSKDRSTITNFLRLLKLPIAIQDSLRNREISMGHARALLSLNDTVKMIHCWKEIIEKDLSVRAVEKLVKEIQKVEEKTSENKTPKEHSIDKDVQAYIQYTENRLRQIFGTKVKIHPKNNDSGSITLEYFNKDDFQRILEIIDRIDK